VHFLLTSFPVSAAVFFLHPCLSVFICGLFLLSLSDKFARVAALRPAHRRDVEPARKPDFPPEYDRLAQLLGAQARRNRYGEHLSYRQWYATPEMCLPDARSLSLLLPQGTLDARGVARSAADPEQWLFLDTETTGLAGGTGTYAFLLGIAWWDAGGLQVEQFFMRDLDEEHSILLELSQRMMKRPVLVTFNGKSFDWPLLETRYRMTRAIPSCTPKLHLDLLHPARQLWRLRLGSVRLQELERYVLGGEDRALEWSRHDDIDSSLIPQMYFDYLRGGPAEPLAGVFRHNQMDLRGLAALAGKILSLFDTGHGLAGAAHHSTHDPIDLCGLSRLMQRRGEPARARQLYETALRAGLPPHVERLAQRALAQLAKREQDYVRAISLWEELRQGSTSSQRQRSAVTLEDAQKALEAAIEAAEQLAMYYEHRAKQPQRAVQLVSHAIAELRSAHRDGGIAAARACKIEARLSRRLARLELRAASATVPELLRAASSSPI
jgi:uncharacterized protein YprB with RNaseH-like and TPR domain